MKTLSIDIETYASTDLPKCGVYKYSESPDFDILLFGYSVDGGTVQVVDLASGENLPEAILRALTDDAVIKWAFNAQFERICLSRWLSRKGMVLDHYKSESQFLSPASWRCTMIWSAYLGLPLSLEGAGAVMGLEKQKVKEGKDLIRYFSMPCKPSKVNGGRERNLPADALEKWEQYKAYNARDVETELEIQRKLFKFPVPDFEWGNYILDQEINDRGILLDMELVGEAIRFDSRAKQELASLMQQMTTLDNPNSVAQMKAWLSEHGMETDTLGNAAVKELLKTAPEPLGQVLELRQSLAKSSVKKYTAMQNAVCSDGRVRGLLQFYGANRTGRWAGRLVQVQNLPQNHLPDLRQVRQLVKLGQYEALEALYDTVPEVLSELIRTAFIPKPGHQFMVADFSAIEARVIAWLAGETWRNEVFAGHGRIYEASASQMFHVPIDEITKGSPLRQKGKIAELALGYGGSVGALKAMGALDMDVAEEELQALVNAWRAANPNIVRFWWAVDRAAMTAVRERTVTETYGIRFACRSGMLFITLPSGRQLSYVKPKIGQNRFGSDAVTYEGVGATKKWERIETYGPKLLENIVQAIARDILCYALLTFKDTQIVMHVHDEIVIEADDKLSLQDICLKMSETPAWAKGLLLRADGFVCPFYQKDQKIIERPSETVLSPGLKRRQLKNFAPSERTVLSMNELQIFSYEGKEVRTLQIGGEPWWVAKDVCDVFGETNRNRAMQTLDEDEKGYTQMTTPGGNLQLAVVNEAGLYALLFAMQPTKARGVSEAYIADREQKLRNFKRWVTHEVLPSIRKHGAYLTADKLEEIMNDPDAQIQVLTALKEERQAKERLQLQAMVDKPKVIFADAVSVSDGTILIGELAKILKGNGIEIGQNRLFEQLRQEGFLIKRRGADYNAPTQKAMELGLFRVKETAITHSDGHVTISKTTKVTGKGQQYFVNFFLGNGSSYGK